VKYKSKRTVVDNILFSSKAEANRYEQLKILLKAGKIKNLELQPKFPIYINDLKICTVILDFKYQEGSKIIFEDVKGFDNPMSKLKRKMVESAYKIKVDLIRK